MKKILILKRTSGIANMEAVRRGLPASKLVISKAGWATTASEFGARADEVQQKRYFNPP